jgi:hypothetical protein
VGEPILSRPAGWRRSAARARSRNAKGKARTLSDAQRPRHHAQAIFDAILIHMMNMVSPGTWHGLKMDLCNALVKNKDSITLQILANTYSKTDIVFLQVLEGGVGESERDVREGVWVSTLVL